ncbi:phosphopantetheine-binding protein, partial [Streptomyces hydrogenans]
DFFALGGDSIVSIRLVSRARSRGLSLSTKDVFRYRTVAALAA